MEEQEPSSGPQVSQWYAGRSLLVTGGTGFLGKAIVEKLLRSCPGIATVYLLLRPKHGRDPKERLEAYTSDVVFSRLRVERPDFARHLSVITGDLTSPNFRLAEQDLAALRRDVSIIFHCAASVRFDESLRNAVNMNVVGTKRVLELAQQMPNLQVFLHTSTSYCHSDNQVLEEKLYPAKADPEKIMDIVSWMDNELLGMITPKLLGKLPNTYALSKNLAEELVARYSDRLPIVIARPSIVISAWKEPLEGWVANFNGPTGFGVACGKGLLRTLVADLDIASDGLPVDCTANSMIVMAWHFAETRQPSPYVFNITNGDQNRVTWEYVIKWLMTICTTEIPLYPMLWYPKLIITTSEVWYTICHFFLELVPAHVLDFFIRLSGRKPFLVRVQHRLQSAKTMVRYYVLHEWKFVNKNLMSLYESLAPEDKQTFNYIVTGADTYEYFRNTVIGAKLYLLNESMDDLPRGRRNMRRMYWLHMMVKVIFCGLLLWLLYSWSQPALELTEAAMDHLTPLFYGAPFIRALADEVPVHDVGSPQDVVDVANGDFHYIPQKND